MEKKKLTKDSVSSWPVYLPNGMSTAENLNGGLVRMVLR